MSFCTAQVPGFTLSSISMTPATCYECNTSNPCVYGISYNFGYNCSNTGTVGCCLNLHCQIQYRATTNNAWANDVSFCYQWRDQACGDLGNHGMGFHTFVCSSLEGCLTGQYRAVISIYNCEGDVCDDGDTGSLLATKSSDAVLYYCVTVGCGGPGC